MRIIDPSKRYHICELKVGDIFEFGGKYWMKTDAGFGDKKSCVRLDDGILTGFKDDIAVRFVEMEAMVK